MTSYCGRRVKPTSTNGSSSSGKVADAWGPADEDVDVGERVVEVARPGVGDVDDLVLTERR